MRNSIEIEVEKPFGPPGGAPVDIEYERPYLYPKQLAAIFEPKRYSLIEASTKAGKTAGCITWLVELAFQGRAGQNYWWVAPVSDQARIAFRRTMRAVPSDCYTANLTDKTITLFNGAVIWFKSGDKPNSLYGEDVYAAVIDEASRMKEDAYIAIRSTLTYTRGPVRIIGNVRGRKNWFYKLARRAEHGDDEMAYHKIIASDAVGAGVLDGKEIEDARTQMPEASWRELYLAEASDDGGNPFGLQHIAGCVTPLSNNPVAWWGWDFAKRHDYTVGIGLDKFGYVARLERFHGMPWDQILDRVALATGRTPALGDSTGLGDPVVDFLQKRLGGGEGSTFQGYHFTPASKQKLMEGLAIAIQSRGVGYPKGVIVEELEQFEFAFTRTGVRYCMIPETPVLTADLRWSPLGSLRAGDAVVGFDENPTGRARRWRRSVVTNADAIMKPCYRITLDDGTEFVCSSDHRWLVANNAGSIRWVETCELRGKHPTSRSPRVAPHRLIRVVDTWQEESYSYEAGYLAAAFDGEGSLSQLARNDHAGFTTRLSFAQRENAMLDAVRSGLRRFGFSTGAVGRGGLNRNVLGTSLTGGISEVLRFLGAIRPKRLLSKFDIDKLGTMWCGKAVPIRSVEFVGNRKVVALSTSTSTFIANGFATHNCAPEGYYDDCVCALALAQMCRTTVPAGMSISPEIIAQVLASGGGHRRRV